MPLADVDLDGAREVFLIFDKQGDQRIDVNDLGSVLRALNRTPLESEVSKIISEIDPSKTARITFEQFAPYLSRDINVPGTAEEFIEGLRVFDRDCNGFMSAAELRHVLTNLGEKLTQKQVDQLIVGVETDKDGNINYEEFVRNITTTF